jgi:hypothetical protein
MALTTQNIEDLQAISRSGGKIHVAEYISVEWDADDANETRYYSYSKLNSLSGFGTIGLDVEAKLLNEPFKTFELFPDLRTETIPIVFDDIDKSIRGKFQTFGSGVRVEFFLFYPQVNAHHSLWFGQLQAPQVYGWKTLETVATNGFRSREQLIPKSLRPQLCRHRAYAGFARGGCHYNPPTIGNYRTGTTPYVDCPGDPTACAARGMTPYFGGYNPDASAVVTDHSSGYLAHSKGNVSALKTPIRVIAGTKTVRANQLLYWRREMNSSNQDRGFVAGVWEVGEGPVQSVRNIKVGEKLIEQMHIAIRLGNPAQQNLFQYAPDIGNFSNVAHYMARKGWVDPLTEDASTMVSECVVAGYTKVTTLTPSVVQTWTNNRTWWLLELMLNERFGMSYPLSRFNTTSWRATADWTGQAVTFRYTNADGETRTFSHTRSSFDCIVEGRPVAEVLVDICRSGRFSIPYQKDGEFHLQPFRAFTAAELAAAPVFTDRGSTQNILWKMNGKIAEHPLIELSQVPDDKIVNEITMVFEDGAHNDQERPITVDSPEQKARAGRMLGDDSLQAVPMRFAAFGCRNLNEVVKLGYGKLYFGDFDEGGMLNNLTLGIEVPLVEALAVQRYQPIKIVSDLLDGFELPDDPLFSSFTQVEYFRVLKITKTSKDTAVITGQAYNHTAYSNFETIQGETPGDIPPWPPDPAPDPDPDPIPGPVPIPCRVSLNSVAYSKEERAMLVDIIC